MNLLHLLIQTHFYSLNYVYIFVYLRYQGVYLKSVTMYVYYYWNDKKYTHILSVSHLNSLCFYVNLGNEWSDLQHR